MTMTNETRTTRNDTDHNAPDLGAFSKALEAYLESLIPYHGVDDANAAVVLRNQAWALDARHERTQGGSDD